MTNGVDAWLGKIHVGDCVAGMQQLPDASIDLAFADPPFNIGFKYDQYEDRLGYDQYLAWSHDWISEVYRVLKSDGTFWLAIGDEYAAELKIEAQKIGFTTRSWVVWYYTFGVHCKLKFTRSHAHIFYLIKDPRKFTFNRQSIAVPSARQLVYGDSRANPAGRTPDDTWILRPQDLPDGFESDEDTWYFPRVNGTFKERAGFHGCQMPEQLLGRIIRACSNEDEVVMDPFSGSASTLLVAKKLGRRFLGFEMSEDYVRRSTERLNAVSEGDRLDGSETPSLSAPATGAAKATTLEHRQERKKLAAKEKLAKPKEAKPKEVKPKKVKPQAEKPNAEKPNAEKHTSVKVKEAGSTRAKKAKGVRAKKVAAEVAQVNETKPPKPTTKTKATPKRNAKAKLMAAEASASAKSTTDTSAQETLPSLPAKQQRSKKKSMKTKEEKSPFVESGFLF